MRRRLPSITTLDCFESAARHESVTKAAEELCLTQSAVSRQIKNLEEMVGCTLFERVKQRLFLTDAGKEYEIKIKSILEQLESATNGLKENMRGQLKIGIEDSLATHWLLPKIHDFQGSFPDIEKEFINNLHLLYDLHDGFDIGVLVGKGNWPGLQSKYLMPEELVAVCTPELFSQYGLAKDAKDIVKYPLLHHTSPPSSTSMWLTAAGVKDEDINKMPGPRFGHFRLLLEAAKEGFGLAILPNYIVTNELRSGQLILACKDSIVCDESYYLVTPYNRINDPKVIAFSDWILGWSNHK